MGQFSQLINNRVIVSSMAAVLLLLGAAAVWIVASLSGQPQTLFRFDDAKAVSALSDSVNISGHADFDKSSYLPGERARYTIRLIWRESALKPDLEAFRNGIGFFPFNRVDMQESRRSNGEGVNEYELKITLQAVDVQPVHSYQLAPPTVYYTLPGDAEQELQSYRIEAPRVHIGEYYPEDVSKVSLLDYKGPILDPRLVRQGPMLLFAMGLFGVAGFLLWHFGRVRRTESLDEPERLWRHYRSLDTEKLSRREYLDQCERVFTGLLRYRLHLSPVLFWSGGNAEAEEWRDMLQEARELFYRNYLPVAPDAETVAGLTRILDQMFARLTEEERLRRERMPTFYQRVASRYGVVPIVMGTGALGLVVFVAAVLPGSWLSRDIARYNEAVSLMHSDASAEDKFERLQKIPELISDPRAKAAALYNNAIFATQPELAGIDQPRQEALLAVMFQEQKVFLDALLHSLNMEDPFLLVSILRDSVRYLTASESSLKAAVRIDADDEQIRRNLELVMKRRNAYAESIEEILRGGEDTGGQGELQKQALMDLEMLMQTEMPDKYAEFEEGKNNKEYFIMEGF